MKSSEFLTEAEKLASPARLVALLQQNCKPFLSQAGWNNPMYRGIDKQLPAVSLQQNRAGRRPLTTNAALSKVADNWFFEKTGIRYRSNAVFTAGDYGTARSYGDVYVMFPIGEFKYCWSPNVEDMFMLVSDLSSRVNRNAPNVEEMINAELINRLNNAEYKTDGLVEAIQSTSELMVYCNKYYLLTEAMYKAVHSLVLRAK